MRFIVRLFKTISSFLDNRAGVVWPAGVVLVAAGFIERLRRRIVLRMLSGKIIHALKTPFGAVFLQK